MRVLSAVLVSLVLVAPTLAGAAPTRSVRSACTADAVRLCSTVLFNKKGLRACARKNFARLSTGCKRAIVASIVARYRAKAAISGHEPVHPAPFDQGGPAPLDRGGPVPPDQGAPAFVPPPADGLSD